jgi:hypothetical protein
MGHYPPPQPAPAAKSSNIWLWILGGILAFTLIIVLGVGMAGFLIFKKVKDSGFTEEAFRRNPVEALSRLATTLNPDYEVLKVDENSRNVIVREKSTGKSITLAFDDQKKILTVIDPEGKEAKVRINEEEGGISVDSEKSSVEIGGGNRAPVWVPAYPGSRVEGAVNVQENNATRAMYSFQTPDEPAKVRETLRDAAKRAGFTVEEIATTVVGSVLTIEDRAKGRKVMYTITGSGGGSQVAVVATEEVK